MGRGKGEVRASDYRDKEKDMVEERNCNTRGLGCYIFRRYEGCIPRRCVPTYDRDHIGWKESWNMSVGQGLGKRMK